jgi:hypothetical protein
MTPQRLDLACQTNSDLTEEWTFEHGGAGVDLTGYNFRINLKAHPESTTTLAQFITVADAASPGIYRVEPNNGRIQVRFPWETIRAAYLAVYPTTFEGDGVSLYYDLLVTLPGGDQEQWLFGFITIRRGITNG